MTNVRTVYITTANVDDARKIAKELVANRLAACVNIFDRIQSFYWWEGEIQDDQEVALLAKTKESLVQEVIEKVKSLHSYSCPCIVSIPVLDGNKAFLDWVKQQTK